MMVEFQHRREGGPASGAAGRSVYWSATANPEKRLEAETVIRHTLPAVLKRNLYLTLAVALLFHGSPEASESRICWTSAATWSPSTGGGSERIRTAPSLY